MKSAVAFACLALTASAQNNTEPETRKFSHIVKMIYSQIETSHQTKTISKMIQNYGCHCFPGMSKIAGGAGPAQDEYDELCRELARCHKCVEIDYGNAIDADKDKYRWDVQVDGSISCANNLGAKLDLCLCDSDYAMKMGAVWQDSKFNRQIWLNKKNQDANFDHAAVCVAKDIGGQADQCCGAYPDRHPFDTLTKMCCNEQSVYSDLTEECCDDGSIAVLGSC